ncbi:HDA1 complex subunit 2 [[Candida] anglica]|uniref:HDA1 complex subunit 2 n=1 Tax=[Candida] anglica TaxID=148631 RepID=A0ABP0E8B7_9ASCO
MNLMSILQDEVVEQVPEQLHNGVYYLPTLLTNMQKDLLELLVEVFRAELLDLANARKQKTSIDSLLALTQPSSPGDSTVGNGTSDGTETASKPSFSSADKINLLFEQLRLIDKHPTLLVDHFIPKKLLLSDINSRMLNVSGKFQLFNRVVDSFIDRYPLDKRSPRSSRGYHMLVVASSVKELELIEGLIIGKKLYYKNLSSAKLYEDNRSIPKEKSSLTASNINDISNQTGNKRRKTSHITTNFHKGNSNGSSPETLCLYLITTQQLYNYTLESYIDLFFSFDLNLKLDSPSIELIRTSSTEQSLMGNGPTIKTPVIIPVPAFSIEHRIMSSPMPSVSFNFNQYSEFENPIFKWKLQAINTFIVNRSQLFDSYDESQFYIDLYGNNMSKLYDWFHEWNKTKYPLIDNYDELLKQSTNRSTTARFNDQTLFKELKSNYLFNLNNQENPSKSISREGNIIAFNSTIDYKSYKANFSNIIQERIATIENSIEENYKNEISNERLRETIVQERIDQDNLKIGEKYNELKKMNDLATISERKLVRVDSDYLKLQKQQDTLVGRVEHLEKLFLSQEQDKKTVKTLNKSEEHELDLLINDQVSTIDDLRSKLAGVSEELEKLIEEEDGVRANYQQSSGEAVQYSAKLDRLKTIGAKLNSELHGPGSKVLPALRRKDELINIEFELNKIKGENSFMDCLLSQKLQKVVKERQGIMESTGSGSSSRGARLSRASTPFEI